MTRMVSQRTSVAPASQPITEFAREQALEGTSRIETLSVARSLADYRFLTAFFLAQRVQSFRNHLKSLARDLLPTYVRQTVSAFLDFFQGTINALDCGSIADSVLVLAPLCLDLPVQPCFTMPQASWVPLSPPATGRGTLWFTSRCRTTLPSSTAKPSKAISRASPVARAGPCRCPGAM
jgi:hypothetical protein